MILAIIGNFLQAWLNLVIAIVSTVIAYRLRGGTLVYPILILGLVAFFSFLTNIIGNTEMIWFTSTLEKLVLLTAVLWFAQIFRP